MERDPPAVIRRQKRTRIARIILSGLLIGIGMAREVCVAGPVPSTEEARRQAYLDEFYPFIEQGAEPPGRAVPSEQWAGALIWEGQRGWRTRHGQAVVRWDSGRPNEVFGARLPDGSRGDVGSTLDHGFRRKTAGEKRWVYGTIDIRPDDVVFTDNPEQPAYAPPPPGGDANLERDLASDPAFLAALADDTFAHALYIVFRNREFVRAADLGIWSCGDRQAARLVAGLRGLGESYHDYYLHWDFAGIWPDDRPRREADLRQMIETQERVLASPPSFDVPIGSNYNGKTIETEEQAERIERKLRESYERNRPKDEASLASLRQRLADLPNQANSDVMLSLRAHLTRLGWRTLNEADERRLGEEAMRKGLDLLKDIKRFEERPAGEPGAWWREPPRRSGLDVRFIALDALADLTPDEQAVRRGLRHRVDALAASGRVDEQQYGDLRNRDQAVQSRIGGYSKR